MLAFFETSLAEQGASGSLHSCAFYHTILIFSDFKLAAIGISRSCGCLQVQGLMDMFDREWCHLYCWTPNGSTIFHIPRDRQYWLHCFEVLADFWWGHVIPAKHALALGTDTDLNTLRQASSLAHLCIFLLRPPPLPPRGPAGSKMLRGLADYGPANW